MQQLRARPHRASIPHRRAEDCQEGAQGVTRKEISGCGWDDGFVCALETLQAEFSGHTFGQMEILLKENMMGMDICGIHVDIPVLNLCMALSNSSMT
jgi:hypothetical protein